MEHLAKDKNQRELYFNINSYRTVNTLRPGYNNRSCSMGK